MPRDSNLPDLAGADDYLRALRDPSRNLRQRYKGNPIALAERLNLILPKKPLQVMAERGLYDPEVHGPIEPGIRELIEDVCLLAVHNAAVVGPRGGGKSMGVSFIEFYLVFIELFDALNLGGSELQADQVYQYLLAFIESDNYWKGLLKGDSMQSKTELQEGAWIRVLTASQKSVRSPHAGGRKSNGRVAGGLLVIDEEAEAAPDIVSAALPTINTARPSVNVRCSTFHNNEGTFAELIDSHAEMGYKLYRWDVFDICERCDCVNECQSEEPCFREDHFEEYVDPDTGGIEQRLLHRAYCGGRARFASGHMPVDEITKMWKRMKRNHALFEVEAMGSRPTSKGYVIKSQQRFTSNITAEPASGLYKQGGPITVCVDWGTIAAGVEVWQQQLNKHVLLHADQLLEAGQTEIFGSVIGYANRYLSDFTEVAADIGGGGNYLNKSLREEHGLPVRDVNFAEEKEAAAAAWNVLSEAGHLIIPAEHETFITQVRRWRRVRERIQKGNDHLCDAALCYFSKFIDEMGLSHIRIVPRSFNSGIGPSTPPGARSTGNKAGRTPGQRLAMVRSIGKRR